MFKQMTHLYFSDELSKLNDKETDEIAQTYLIVEYLQE